MDKKIAAQQLYNEGYDQKDIARVLSVTEKTISQWKRKYKWEEKRINQITARETAQESLYDLINYQLQVLRRIKDKYLEEDPDTMKLLAKGDIDALQKMFVAVKGKEQDWTNVVQIVREFIDHIQQKDLELSKKVLDHADDFLNKKRSVL